MITYNDIYEASERNQGFFSHIFLLNTERRFLTASDEIAMMLQGYEL